MALRAPFLAASASTLLASGVANAASDACHIVDGGSPGASHAFANALAANPLYAFLLTWLSGLGVALTPCVYPMIVVTVSIFGAKQAASRWQSVGLSAVFVLGIVTLFVPLGVGAAKTGSLMGAWLQSPWVFVGIALLLLAMAASMFGAFDLALPQALQNRLSEVGGVGYRGAFALGLVSALIATPCTGPFLTGLVVWIAESQNVLLGAVMMGAFALGLGLPFFVVGAFAMHLPKSGRWMNHVKVALGIVLVVGALYYLGGAFPILTRPALPDALFVVAMVAVVGLGIIGIAVAVRRRGWSAGVLKGVGIALASLGAYLGLVGAMKPPPGVSVAWQSLSLEVARSQAQADARPLLVDFTADWCVACKELDKYTFSAPEVAYEATRFLAVKVDLSDNDDAVAEDSKERHRVVGLPTVLLFDSKGQEAVRCTDYVPPDDFVGFVRQVK